MLRITSAVRRAVARPGEIGATEPLEFHSMLGPTDTTPGSGGGPSHGPTTRTSTPSLRSSRARPSTCPCTPPGRDSEYGEVITTRTPSTHSVAVFTGTPVALFTGTPVAGPVRLQEVPLLGRDADQLLELVGEDLRDPLDVLAQLPHPFHLDRRPYDTEMVTARAEVDRGRHERRTGAQRERRGSAGQRRAVADEVDLHPVAFDVAVGKETRDAVFAQRLQYRARDARSERHDGDADRRTLRLEPLEQWRRRDAADDSQEPVALQRHPCSAPPPPTE